MVSAIARTIPTVAGFSAMCPLLVPGCRIFIGNNRRRCVSYFTLRWLSKKCNFEPRASVSSVDEGQRPSHRPRCDRQYDRGCEHQTQQTKQERAPLCRRAVEDVERGLPSNPHTRAGTGTSRALA